MSFLVVLLYIIRKSLKRTSICPEKKFDFLKGYSTIYWKQLAVFRLVIWIHITQQAPLSELILRKRIGCVILKCSTTSSSLYLWFFNFNITQQGCFRNINSLRGACTAFQYYATPVFPPVSILSGQISLIKQWCGSMFFVNCELAL